MALPNADADPAAVGEKNRFVWLGVAEGVGPRWVRRPADPAAPPPIPAPAREADDSRSMYL